MGASLEGKKKEKEKEKANNQSFIVVMGKGGGVSNVLSMSPST